jgi:hypothetical protein
MDILGAINCIVDQARENLLAGKEYATPDVYLVHNCGKATIYTATAIPFADSVATAMNDAYRATVIAVQQAYEVQRGVS